jgi:BASS family bile acid:Na+ symporter
MTIVGKSGVALAWLGRNGTRAVGVSILAGIALPPLGALVRPYFAETVVALLILSFLRVDPQALRAQWLRPRLLIGATVWTMLALPILVLALLSAIASGSEPGSWQRGLFLALVLQAVAPPIFSSPSLAALIGLNGAISLGLLIACTALTPFTAPALVAAFFGADVTLSPLALGIRLALMLAGAAVAATVIRAFAGKPWVERQRERIDGLSVIVLFLFAVALMGDVLQSAIARPPVVLGMIALSFAVSLLLSALTALAFVRAGWSRALTLGHSAGSRNMGLMLAAAAGAVPELVWLYIGLAQLPIYLLPLLFEPLSRRLLRERDRGPK